MCGAVSRVLCGVVIKSFVWCSYQEARAHLSWARTAKVSVAGGRASGASLQLLHATMKQSDMINVESIARSSFKALTLSACWVQAVLRVIACYFTDHSPNECAHYPIPMHAVMKLTPHVSTPLPAVLYCPGILPSLE